MPDSDCEFNVDDILEQIGHFGRFQLKQYVLMVIPILFNGLFFLNYVFTAGRLNYRCAIPECDTSQNASYYPAWLNNTVPIEDGKPSQCKRFLPISNTSSYCDANSFDHNTTIECSSFIFESTEVTIVKDFNITCSHNDWKLALVGTIHSFGQFVALPILGYISDRFGRRQVLLISVVGTTSFGLLRSYTTSYGMFLGMEFLEPSIGSTMYTTAFILAMELVGPKMRVTGNSIMSCSFAIGEAILGLIAMYISNWRMLLRVIYFPGIILLLLVTRTSESVRWLIANGHKEKAIDVLQKAARMNGKELPASTIETYLTSNSREEDSFFSTLKCAFRNSRILQRLLICSFCWMANGLVYYGLSLNAVRLAGDKHINFILVSLAELPGIVVMQLLLDRIGRKATLSSSMLLCGLFCLLSEFILTDYFWLNVAMFLISKMAITVSFDSIYIYTAEIFPTNLRQSLLSYCSMFARVGSTIAPQTPLLAKIWSPLPMVAFGSVGIVSGLAILVLPETLNTPLPDTLEEAMSINPEDTISENQD